MTRKRSRTNTGIRPARRRELAAIADQIVRLPPGDARVFELTATLSPDEHAYVGSLVVDDDVDEAPAPITPSAAPPTLRSSWVYFAWLLLTAVALYYAKLPILIVATIVAVVILWVKFAMRFPMTALVIMGFLSGLMRGGRR